MMIQIYRGNYCNIETSCFTFLQKHFESSQFESRRLDGWRRLKPNAVPTLFDVPNPPPRMEVKRRVLKRKVTDADVDKPQACKLRFVSVLPVYLLLRS
jgi:hypothetical protein